MSDLRSVCAAGAVCALLLAGCGGSGAARHTVPTTGQVATVPGGTVVPAAAALVPDPESAQSSPEPSGAPAHPDARAPTLAPSATTVAPGAPSDAQVRAELAQMNAALSAARHSSAAAAARVPAAAAAIAGSGGYSTAQGGGTIDGQGNASPPAGAPAAIARLMGAGNAIATFPYRWGGGHASFVDNAYDCSGSVSYALAAAGMLSAPLTSGELMNWGVPGPGRWLTVMAKAGHTYLYAAGLRFDTSFRNGPYGTRWQPWSRSNQGFVARHWPGL